MKVAFLGSKELGFQVAEQIYNLDPDSLTGVVTIDDSKDSRSALSSFEQFAKKTACNVVIAKTSRDAIAALTQLSPDIVFVVGWYRLLDKKILRSIPRGFIGIHNSLLPKYRGGSPLVWQMINGETTVGTSIFSLSEGTDDGPIWAQRSIPVGSEDYINDVLTKLTKDTLQCFSEIYNDILSQKIQPRSQEHELATYCSLRSPEDGEIDWNSAAKDIHNFIRAQSHPYPGAFTFYENKKISIWRASLFDKPFFGVPGQVVTCYDTEVAIVCGDGNALIIQDIECDGQKYVPKEILNSMNIRLARQSISVARHV